MPLATLATLAPEAPGGTRRRSARNPAISVCMIVRDEERVLARCLRSVADVADELCVVDTGSSDRTVRVAERFGAHVVVDTSCNGPDGRISDFSVARNRALDLATGDWILWLDADEALMPGGAARLRRHARAARHAAMKITLHDHGTEWASPRFFRRTPAHRFAGRVHEWVTLTGRVGMDREIQIRHRPDKRGKEGSGERNIRLLRAVLAEDPDDVRARFYMGNALLCEVAYREAIQHYECYLALGGGYLHERYTVVYSIAVCHLLLGEPDAAIEHALRALHLDPRYAEAHCVLGDAWLQLGVPDFARQWFRSALACRSPPDDAVLFIDRALYGPYPRHRLRQLGAPRAGRTRPVTARGRGSR